MLTDEEVNSICANLLNLYEQADGASSHEINTLRVHKAQQYALADIYSFFYDGVKYYVSNDYSLDDNPKYVEALIRDVDHSLTGRLLKSPVSQDDGAIYAVGMDGTEYYMWKCAGQ